MLRLILLLGLKGCLTRVHVQAQPNGAPGIGEGAIHNAHRPALGDVVVEASGFGLHEVEDAQHILVRHLIRLAQQASVELGGRVQTPPKIIGNTCLDQPLCQLLLVGGRLTVTRDGPAPLTQYHGTARSLLDPAKLRIPDAHHVLGKAWVSKKSVATEYLWPVDVR